MKGQERGKGMPQCRVVSDSWRVFVMIGVHFHDLGTLSQLECENYMHTCPPCIVPRVLLESVGFLL